MQLKFNFCLSVYWTIVKFYPEIFKVLNIFYHHIQRHTEYKELSVQRENLTSVGYVWRPFEWLSCDECSSWKDKYKHRFYWKCDQKDED